MWYCGGSEQTFENDLYTKTANSMAENNMKVYHADVDPANLPSPTDPIWNEVTNQTLIDKLKEQNSDQTIETATNTFEANSYYHNAPTDGSMSVKLEGQTLKNEVINGNFADGTTGWSAGGATLSASNNILSNTGTGSSPTPNTARVTVINSTVGRKIYVRATVKITNNVCNNVRIYTYDGTNSVVALQVNTPVQNQQYILSGICTQVATGTIAVFIKHYYPDSATANGKVMEVKDVICLDLTALGLESKTVEELDAMTQKYFDGIKSTAEVDKKISTDFMNKTSGSSVENGNVMKHNHLTGNTSLLSPTGFTAEGSNTYYYDKVKTLDGATSMVTATNNGGIPQNLFSFNIISETERKWGREIPGTTLAEKVQWCKDNINKITCNWWGYGSCPSGNKATLAIFKVSDSTWAVGNSTTSSSVSNLNITNTTEIPTRIDSDGKIHFLAFTDASDGVTASTIFSDYVSLNIEMKPQVDVVHKIEVLSKGKNLFDKTKVTNGMILEGLTGLIKSNPITFYSDYIEIKPNVNYTINKGLGSASYGHCFYDINETYITGVVSSITNPQTLTAPSNAKFIRIVGLITNLDSIQLEEGTTATTYEAYKQDKIDILPTQPLRSLPNGTRDSISSGGIVTKRIGKKVFDGSESWEEFTSPPEVDTISFKLQNIEGCKSISTNLPPITLVERFASKVYNNWFVEDSEYFASAVGNFYIRILKSKLATQDVAGLKAWLSANPTTVYYELATPTTEKVNPLLLQSFKNGTLEVDSDIPSKTTETHNTDINDYSVLSLSCSEVGKSKAILCEVSLDSICSSLYGGSNTALKSALKKIYIEMFASSNSNVIMSRFRYVENKWASAIPIGTNWNVEINTPNITKITFTDNPSANDYIAQNSISSDNKIYILLMATDSATLDTPSVLNADYVNVKVDLSRVADVIAPIPVELGDTWSILLKGVAPSWDSNEITSDKYIFSAKVDDNNQINLRRVSATSSFRLSIRKDGVWLGGITSNTSTFNKYTTHNFLVQYSNGTAKLRFLKNNGSIESYIVANNITTGLNQLYLCSNLGISQGNSFLDNLYFFNNKTFTDEEAEVILRGRNTIEGKENNATLNELAEMFKNPLIQTGYILPNNRYIITGQATLYSNGYLTRTVEDEEFTTSKWENKIVLSEGGEVRRLD